MIIHRILVVDDDAEVGDFIAAVARDCGYDVAKATAAEAALAGVRDWRPTHIVLDLNMPQVDGLEMLRRLSEAGCRAKILIASGVDERVAAAARRLGVARGLTIVGIVAKPIRRDELRAILNGLREAEDWLDDRSIARAIETGEFFLEYQPKIELRTQRVVGMEALLRWQHPTRGVVQPGEFIPVVELSNTVDDLTRWVVGAAVRQLDAWSSIGLDIGVAINLSARNLAVPSIAEDIAGVCTAAGVDPARITMEVTETAAMSDPIAALEILSRLRMKGMHLAMDDFGTGYSSLAQLQRLPFSELKIDRVFVAECDASRDGRVIVNAMIGLAHNLGVVCVAEGVETPEQLGVLEDLGCDMVQGYLIARAMTAARLPSWLEAWRRQPTVD